MRLDVDLDQLRALVAAGCTGADVLDAIERGVSAHKEREASRKREMRQDRRASADIEAVSTDASADTNRRPRTRPRTSADKERSPPIPPSKETHTHTGARAREATSISQGEGKAADAFLRAIGVDPTAPELFGLSGAPHFVAGWLSAGWSIDQMVNKAKSVMSKRRGDVPGIDYWIKVFSKPAPQPELPLLRTIEGGKDHETAFARRPREPWQERRDRQFETLRQLREGIDAAERARNRGG